MFTNMESGVVNKLEELQHDLAAEISARKVL